MHLRFTFLILKDKGTLGGQVETVPVFHDDILYCTVNINLHIYMYTFVMAQFTCILDAVHVNYEFILGIW